MATNRIWFMSFLVYGCFLQTFKGQKKAEYKTSSWNRNKARHWPINDPHLGVVDIVNIHDQSEQLEPATNSIGIDKSKSLPAQEMHRAGYIVSDGESVSRKHVPVKKAQTKTTIQPRQSVMAGIETTDLHRQLEVLAINRLQNPRRRKDRLDVFDKTTTPDDSEEFESVTSHQPQNPTTTEPQQEEFDKTFTEVGIEEYEPVTTNQPQNPTTEAQEEEFDRTVTADGLEEHEPVTSNRPQNPTTIEPQEEELDRIVTALGTEEQEPLTDIQPLNPTTESQLEGYGKTLTTDGFEELEQMMNNKPYSPITIAPRHEEFKLFITTKGLEEFESVTTDWLHDQTTTDSQLEVADRTEKFRPLSKNQHKRRTTKPPLELFDRINTPDNSEEFVPVTQSSLKSRQHLSN